MLSTKSIMSLSQANNYLAVHLHRLLTEKNANVFFSPFSISTAMAMVLCAAEGQTEIEMRKALGYDEAGIEKHDIPSAFQELMSIFIKTTESCTLTSANSVLSQVGFDMKDEYKSVLRESFKALLLEVNFQSDTKRVVDQINNWVKEKTNNMIPKILKILYPTTVMVLVNAVYFKGNWLQQFDKALTKSRRFYNYGVEKKAKTVKMMFIKKCFPFSEKETFQALQLPYAGENIAMLVLLPRKRDGLKDLEAKITPSFVEDLSKDLRTKKVKVSLPRFRLEYSEDLVPFFKKMRVEKLFSGAELGGACDCSGLAVSQILHKAVLEVNEEGSEASAATAVVVLRCLVIEPEFTVDHPFLFVIHDVKSNFILFMGRIEEL